MKYGNLEKHLMVEVYLSEFKLCVHPHVNKFKVGFFSRACTIGKTHIQLTKSLLLPCQVKSRLRCVYCMMCLPRQSVDCGRNL